MCHQHLKQRTWGMHTFTSPAETCHRHHHALYIPVSHVTCRMSSKILAHHSDWRPKSTQAHTGNQTLGWFRTNLWIWLKICTNNPTFHHVWHRSTGKGQKHTCSKCKQKNLNYVNVWASCCSEVRERILNFSSSLKETTSRIWPKAGKKI